MTETRDEVNIHETNARLFQIINSMSETEKLKLLKELEDRLHTKPEERREYHREYKIIEASCSTRDKTLANTSIHKISFRDSIYNISKGGVFIKTAYPFRIDQKLSLIFHLSKDQESIKIKGKIVRLDTNGIGVKFDTPLNVF